MKYQVRIRDRMSDKRASELLNSFDEAVKELERVQKEITETWATPDINAAYIFINHRA